MGPDSGGVKLMPDFVPAKLAVVRRSPRAAVRVLTAASPFVVCLILLLTGWPLLDDYGVHFDQVHQRRLAQATVDYALRANDDLLREDGGGAGTDRYYGVAFFGLLELVERGLGLAEERSVALSRHFLTHLFFLAAGLCCYRLVWHLFGSRWLAMLAMLLFLFHPRLYAHSFFNTKDLPFLSMFMVALYLVERAWRRDTWGAFLLGGVAVGLLTNVRVIGVMLLPAALALRGMDLFYAGGAGRRKHILVTGGIFAAAAGLTLYATWPFLWSDPVGNFVAAGRVMAQFPYFPYTNLQLFQGEFWRPDELPWRYVPVWAVISTPPAVLLLGVIGAAAVAGLGIVRPRAVWSNTRLRFGLLLLAGVVLPVAAVALLGATLYTGWRQMFFIYTPWGLLAAYGIGWLLAAYKGWRARAAVYGLTGLGVGLAAWQMVQLHPYGEMYFNFLADRASPEGLRGQYDLPYSRASLMAGYRYALRENPGGVINLGGERTESWGMLRAEERRRLGFDGSQDPDYYIIPVHRRYAANGRAREVFPPAVYRERRYNNTALTVATPDLARVDDATAGGYRELYRGATAGEPLLRADFDAYRYGGRLVLVKERCQAGDLAAPFQADIYPADGRELPAGRRAAGFSGSGEIWGVKFDGKCLAATALPDYAIARIRVYQVKEGTVAWEGDYYSEGYAADFRERYAAAAAGHLAARAVFDLYLGDKAIVYLKEPCRAADTQDRFFLHIVPASREDLPAARQTAGFDNRDFAFEERGVRLEGKCWAGAALPDYPISGIRTGQFVGGKGNVWQVELAVGE